MNIPENVKIIMDVLYRNGYEAYAVGGCVRDTILGKEPEDWDITTNALPKEVKSLFKRTVDTGIAHGTVTVMFGRTGYEITTYRLDGDYSDGRHPDRVTFTPSLSEDLKRRDFTINAMAFSERDGLVDLFGGREDLTNRRIRCVGDPDERFTEDALRILRAVRFGAQLGFTIERATWDALKHHAPNLVRVSRERIFTELNKTLLSDHPEHIGFLADAGITPFVCPSFGPVRPDGAAAELPKERHLRWAAALAGRKPAEVRQVLTELKSDNDTKEKAAILAEYLVKKLPSDRTEARRLLSEIGPGLFDDLLLLSEKGFGCGTGEEVRTARRMKDESVDAGDCWSLKTLAVTGNDLIRAGKQPGPEIGRTLTRLLSEVIEHPEHNTKEKLLTLV